MLPILAWAAAVLAVLILAAIALILMLLTVPMGVQATGASESGSVTVRFLWFFGAIRVPLTGRSQDHDRTKRRTAQSARTKAKRQKRKNRFKTRARRPQLSEVPVIVRAMTILLPRVTRRFRISANADVHFGLDDPADTGLIWGVTAPILPRYIRRTGIRVQPLFAGATLAMYGRISVDVVPITVVVPLFQFLFSRDGHMVLHILRGRS